MIVQLHTYAFVSSSLVNRAIRLHCGSNVFFRYQKLNLTTASNHSDKSPPIIVVTISFEYLRIFRFDEITTTTTTKTNRIHALTNRNMRESIRWRCAVRRTTKRRRINIKGHLCIDRKYILEPLSPLCIDKFVSSGIVRLYNNNELENCKMDEKKKITKRKRSERIVYLIVCIGWKEWAATGRNAIEIKCYLEHKIDSQTEKQHKTSQFSIDRELSTSTNAAEYFARTHTNTNTQLAHQIIAKYKIYIYQIIKFVHSFLECTINPFLQQHTENTEWTKILFRFFFSFYSLLLLLHDNVVWHSFFFHSSIFMALWKNYTQGYVSVSAFIEQ